MEHRSSKSQSLSTGRRRFQYDIRATKRQGDRVGLVLIRLRYTRIDQSVADYWVKLRRPIIGIAGLNPVNSATAYRVGIAQSIVFL